MMALAFSSWSHLSDSGNESLFLRHKKLSPALPINIASTLLTLPGLAPAFLRLWPMDFNTIGFRCAVANAGLEDSLSLEESRNRVLIAWRCCRGLSSVGPSRESSQLSSWGTAKHYCWWLAVRHSKTNYLAQQVLKLRNRAFKALVSSFLTGRTPYHLWMRRESVSNSR
jgi:hypothetical protein